MLAYCKQYMTVLRNYDRQQQYLVLWKYQDTYKFRFIRWIDLGCSALSYINWQPQEKNVNGRGWVLPRDPEPSLKFFMDAIEPNCQGLNRIKWSSVIGKRIKCQWGNTWGRNRLLQLLDGKAKEDANRLQEKPSMTVTAYDGTHKLHLRLEQERVLR